MRVAFRLDPGAPFVFADRIQVQQVLLRNAIEAMQDAPRRELVVATRALAAERLVEISVSDTGTGIAAEISNQLFQPFITTKAHGMGVGLSICPRSSNRTEARSPLSPKPAAGRPSG